MEEKREQTTVLITKETLIGINAVFEQLNIEWFYYVGFDDSGEIKIQGYYSSEKAQCLENNGYKRLPLLEKITSYHCYGKDNITIVLTSIKNLQCY